MHVLITQGLGTFGSTATLAIIIVAAATIAWTWTRRSPEIRPAVVTAVTLSSGVLLFRIIAEEYISNDEITWHSLGVAASNYLAGESSAVVGYVDGKEGYIWLIGVLYLFAGPTPLAGMVLNIACHGLLVIVAARIAAVVAPEISPEAKVRMLATRVTAFLVACLPSFVIWTPRLLRETLCALLIGVCILTFIHLLRRRGLWSLVILAASIGALMQLRLAVGIAILVALASTALLTLWSNKSMYAARLVGLLPVFGFGALMVWNVVDGALGLSPEEIALRNRDLASASSGFSGTGGLSGSAGIADFLTVNLPSVLLGPFPWEIDTSGVMLLALVDGIFWIGAVIAVLTLRPFRAIRRANRDTAATSSPSLGIVTILVLVAVLILVLALSIANYGLLARMRLMPMIALLPLAGIAIAMVRQRMVDRAIANAGPRTVNRRVRTR